ncbi:NUDIX hydrolase [Jeotgalibacillus salarius]|uniref:NUDIX domain-containing protein n=1 Tax=Jeotgalibacillus salarius TaxID=546023 RepID=A0A4Y8LHG3_9BACL|nr:NUDIX domain-containing protein [Jeotgalibacillus salarius]TFE02266.1 NUDIX domain-containing protein [Jeotgalibacillus salarius]
MESERLKIFNEKHQYIGEKARSEVHEKGYWHETFHCWLVENNSLYFQLRSEDKKDYPGLLDITAAGHLLAKETVRDGVREMQEEIGIQVPFEQLQSLGVIECVAEREGFIDKEFAHTFLLKSKFNENDFDLEDEEVTGIVKADLEAFRRLCSGQLDEINIQGFKIRDGSKVQVDESVGLESFVPHKAAFYLTVLERIGQYK